MWALRGGTWSAAAVPAAVLALFSYLTGFLLLALFHPTARSVQITELNVPIPNLPKEFDGYRILHLSDLHVSVYTPPAQARKRIAHARDLRADLVAFTGDLTDDPKLLEEAAEILASVARPTCHSERLATPDDRRECGGELCEESRPAEPTGGRRPVGAPDGLFAVMGNHDNWQGASEVTATLKKHGLTPLINTHHTIQRANAKLHLAGVDNVAYSDRGNLDAALSGIGEDETVILLSHAPEIILHPASRRAALLLAGHTHGGQIVLPLIGAFYLPSKLGRQYASGLFHFNHTHLYITRGLGEIFPPLRVLCPPEIALITLRRP